MGVIFDFGSDMIGNNFLIILCWHIDKDILDHSNAEFFNTFSMSLAVMSSGLMIKCGQSEQLTFYSSRSELYLAIRIASNSGIVILG